MILEFDFVKGHDSIQVVSYESKFCLSIHKGIDNVVNKF